jgi:hypothetical protein
VTSSVLHLLGDRARPLALAAERVLPVPPPFVPILPGGGLRRGSVVGLAGPGSTSLTMALLAEVSRSGSWVVAVGLPHLGLAAAAELGLDLERLVLVARPEPSRWATVTAALLDAFEVVLVQPTHAVRPADARRLEARARDRGAVLMQTGGRADAWPHAPDLSLRVTASAWAGLSGSDGHGRLHSRRVTVEVQGRRQAARVRRAELWLPAADGSVALVAPVPADRPAPLVEHALEVG